MKISDANPFVRYARIQPTILSAAPLGCAYDHRMFYVLEGSSKLVLSDRSITVCAGMLIFLPPATPYYFDGNIKTVVINFDMTRNHTHQKKPLSICKDLSSFSQSNILEKDTPEEFLKLIIIKDAFEVEKSLLDCVSTFVYPMTYSDAETSAIMKRIICYVASRREQFERKIPDLVQRILLYIQWNCDKDLSNEHISQVFGYNSLYLNRIFKMATGTTIHQRLIMERIFSAKKLLINTNFTVNEIAHEVGFEDCAQFCKTFKKYTEYTPTEYRTKK